MYSCPSYHLGVLMPYQLKASLEETPDKLPMLPMCGGMMGRGLQTNKLNLEFIKHDVTVIKRKIDCTTYFLKDGYIVILCVLFYVFDLFVCASHM